MAQQTEPRNPFYFLLLATGVLFTLTIFAYLFVPLLEQKAREMGEIPPPSPFRDALRRDGWKWILGELAVLFVLCLASMGLDRYRRYRAERETTTKVD